MKKLVLFGDSLSYGYGVYKKDSIEGLLSKEYLNEYEIINSGLNGDTTRGAIKRLFRDVISHKPDAVTILFGSNDSAMSDYYYVTPFEFEKNLGLITESIKASLPECKIILITPPPVDDSVFMPSTLNKRLKDYVSIIRNIAKEFNLSLFDLNIEFMVKAGANIEEYLQEDGCHLTEKGYIVFFDGLKKYL